LRFSLRWLWRMQSSEMWRRVDLVWTDVSEERIASIFRVEESATEEPAWAGGYWLKQFQETGSVLRRKERKDREFRRKMLIESRKLGHLTCQESCLAFFSFRGHTTELSALNLLHVISLNRLELNSIICQLPTPNCGDSLSSMLPDILVI
jgi:hypothetical protein